MAVPLTINKPQERHVRSGSFHLNDFSSCLAGSPTLDVAWEISIGGTIPAGKGQDYCNYSLTTREATLAYSGCENNEFIWKAILENPEGEPYYIDPFDPASRTYHPTAFATYSFITNLWRFYIEIKDNTGDLLGTIANFSTPGPSCFCDDLSTGEGYSNFPTEGKPSDTQNWCGTESKTLIRSWDNKTAVCLRGIFNTGEVISDDDEGDDAKWTSLHTGNPARLEGSGGFTDLPDEGDTNSKWISYLTNSSSPRDKVDTTYIYETSLMIGTARWSEPAHLSGRYAVDDSVEEVTVNGTVVTGLSGGAEDYWTYFILTEEYLRPGKNTMKWKVKNEGSDPSDPPAYTGLRVEFKGW
tara:strand:+ start:686 stop:1750 length:1065 start_codon:yes stop_codon:yes gene_type:complete